MGAVDWGVVLQPVCVAVPVAFGLIEQVIAQKSGSAWEVPEFVPEAAGGLDVCGSWAFPRRCRVASPRARGAEIEYGATLLPDAVRNFHDYTVARLDVVARRLRGSLVRRSENRAGPHRARVRNAMDTHARGLDLRR